MTFRWERVTRPANQTDDLWFVVAPDGRKAALWVKAGEDAAEKRRAMEASWKPAA